MVKLMIIWLIAGFPGFCLAQLEDLQIEKGANSKVSPYLVPSVLVGYGLVSLSGHNAIRQLDYSTHAELREDNPGFSVKIDDYMRHMPAMAVYGLDFAGMKAKSSIIDRSLKLMASYVVVSMSVSSLKSISNRSRPNGSSDRSFPSSHTAMAFMTAEFLNQEYKDQSILYSIGGYAVAAGTGVLRLYNNAHWVSDIVAGAGIGILSTKLIYLAYPLVNNSLFGGKPGDVFFSPSYQQGQLGFTLIKRF